jgi:hypothetical protein
VREPVTVTPDSSLAGTPKKLICVDGEASRAPGTGDTVTRSPASAADTFSVCGTQLGDTLALTAPGCAGELAHADASPTTAPAATSTAANTFTAVDALKL